MSKSDELREQAAELDAKAEESFQRCDTDGFLSQWASGLAAQKKRAQAEIEDNGGLWSFPCLWDLKDNCRVDADLIDGKYGKVWILSNDYTERWGRRFIPFDSSHIDPDDQPEYWTPSRSRVQKNLRLVQRWEDRPAVAVIRGSGTGLSGQAWVEIVQRKTTS
jgi:hypothetical protein